MDSHKIPWFLATDGLLINQVLGVYGLDLLALLGGRLPYSDIPFSHQSFEDISVLEDIVFLPQLALIFHSS